MRALHLMWLFFAMSLTLPVFASPVAVNDTIYALEDQPISLNVLDNDYDLEGNPLFSFLLNEENGAYVSMNSDGYTSVTFYPNFNGTLHFTYQACNSLSGSNCSIGYVTLIIAPVNDPPSPCMSNNVEICENGVFEGDVVFNSYIDTYEGQSTYLTEFSTNAGTSEFDALGNVVFIPPIGFSGNIVVTYTVCDTGEPSECSTYTNSYWSVASNTISIQTNAIINPSCKGSSNGRINLNATGGIGYLEGVWNTGYNGLYYNNIPEGEYSISIHDHGNCAADTTVFYNLTAPQVLTYSTENTLVDCNTNSASFNLVPAGGASPYTISWFDGTESDSRSVTVNQTWSISITDNIGCHLDTAIFISGESCTLENFIFPEGFSPNYDGLNDLFYIQNLPPTINGKLVVWNLNGRTVYEREDYQNDWSGIDDLTGERVPNSTYFYIFEDVKTGDKKEGTITIQY